MAVLAGRCSEAVAELVAPHVQLFVHDSMGLRGFGDSNPCFLTLVFSFHLGPKNHKNQL